MLVQLLLWHLVSHNLRLLVSCRSRFAEGLDLKHMACVVLMGVPRPAYATVPVSAMRQRLYAWQPHWDAGQPRMLSFLDWEADNNAFSVIQAAGRVLRGPPGPAAYHAGCLVMVGKGFADLIMKRRLPKRLTDSWQQVPLHPPPAAAAAAAAAAGQEPELDLAASVQTWIAAKLQQGLLHPVPGAGTPVPPAGQRRSATAAGLGVQGGGDAQRRLWRAGSGRGVLDW